TVNVFCLGANGHLLDFWLNGDQWEWADHGLPPGTARESVVSGVAWIWKDGTPTVNVFCLGANGHLLDFWLNGDQWEWADHGLPPETTVASTPAPVAWIWKDGTPTVNVFCLGANGHLLDFWLNGDQWEWTDHGLPPG